MESLPVPVVITNALLRSFVRCPASAEEVVVVADLIASHNESRVLEVKIKLDQSLAHVCANWTESNKTNRSKVSDF